MGFVHDRALHNENKRSSSMTNLSRHKYTSVPHCYHFPSAFTHGVQMAIAFVRSTVPGRLLSKLLPTTRHSFVMVVSCETIPDRRSIVVRVTISDCVKDVYLMYEKFTTQHMYSMCPSVLTKKN